MCLAFRVTLPTQPFPVHFGAVAVHGVGGREVGVQVVSTSSAGEVSRGLAHSDRPIYESLAQPRLSASQPTEAHAQQEDKQESCSKTQGQGGVDDDPM